jgi:hypothetical protein
VLILKIKFNKYNTLQNKTPNVTFQIAISTEAGSPPISSDAASKVFLASGSFSLISASVYHPCVDVSVFGSVIVSIF